LYATDDLEEFHGLSVSLTASRADCCHHERTAALWVTVDRGNAAYADGDSAFYNADIDNLDFSFFYR
jgi:hypothetical protein